MEVHLMDVTVNHIISRAKFKKAIALTNELILESVKV